MKALSTLVAALLVATVAACTRATGADGGAPPGFPNAPAPPADNVSTPQRVELGQRLFYDTRLSRTQDVACASCHAQANAFADPRRVSVGVEGRTGTRNAPAIVNLAWNTSFFWDGGVKTLEQQVIGPIVNPLEMDMTMNEVVERMKREPRYVTLSVAAYGTEPRPDVVTRSIAAFMRTLVSNGSRYDRYLAGDKSALDASEKRGLDIAMSEKGECFHCHVGFNLTNNQLANNGMTTSDPGRRKVTERAEDDGLFKVPTLRNVALTAPYMHDGSLATLRDVVEHYARGGAGHPNTDPTIHPLDLSEGDKNDLVAFLGSLTDPTFASDPRFARK